jgi:3'-5' exoribonuclease
MNTPQPRHPQKGAFIVNLKPGDRVTAFFLVRHKQLEPFRDRSKGEFLTLMLGDRTGQLLARVWEGAPELAETFTEGDVVKVAGDVEEYLGRAQLIVNKLRPARDDEYDLADFLPATEKDVEAMLAAVDAVIAGMTDPHLAALVRQFYDDADFRARLAQAPAARRVHHAYLGGLLEHLTEVLTLADAVLALYPEINADLLRAGVLLHDVGKLREYTWARDIDYTDEGRLIGHIVLSDEMTAEVIARLPDFPGELALRVRHMLVSHHGRYEWGSPRRPKTLEALALYHIENLSAQLNRFKGLLAARREPGQTWTDYDRLLDRQLYAGPGDDLSVEESSQIE